MFKNYLTSEDKQLLNQATGGQNCPTNSKEMDKCDQQGGQNCPLIVNYYKNKIKILCDDVRVKIIDKDKFEYLIKKSLKFKLSNIAYDICIKNAKVDLVTDYLIIMSVSTTDILKENTHGAFELAVDEVLFSMLKEIDV